MLFDSLFSINEQQKAKSWSDFFKELKKDMKEIYNKFGGNAEWTTFLTRFSNDLSRASNYVEFETLQSIYSKELEELQQTITTDKTQQQLLEQDSIDFELQSALQNDLKDLDHLSNNKNKDDEEQTVQKYFEQDLDDLQNDKLNLEIKESINKQDDKDYQYKGQLSTETKENIRENPKNSHLIPIINLKNFLHNRRENFKISQQDLPSEKQKKYSDKLFKKELLEYAKHNMSAKELQVLAMLVNKEPSAMNIKHKEFLHEVLIIALINNKNLKENDPIKLALAYNIQNSKSNQTSYSIFNNQKGNHIPPLNEEQHKILQNAIVNNEVDKRALGVWKFNGENQNNLTQNNANVNEMVKNTTNDNLIKGNNIKQNNIIDNNNVKNNNDLSFLDDEPIDFNQGNHSVDFNGKKSVKNNTEKKPLSPKLQAFEYKSKQNIQNALTKSKELKNDQSLSNNSVTIPMEMNF
ncbi:hypothetical protein [Helicobacter pylori]|uniref:Uncharacterized protein n=1 Tax=Helicobacter pylori HP260AFii TaxID=1159077 RepID=A0ABC9SAA5_HELPX|nr:hypothetical protein [Helicobacter pylori]EMH19974.1 hypothetical protein HMPREF1416_00574 [Helicobacter pylori GAM260ASi]EMH32596.1 hypothetical protein HMPREF1422_00076 [Helicobacter pylori GAM268Bii]EMH64458.1 hypothetical protein HMPREF1448_00427 [Helicobacter pylori HP260AFi]EMH66981.1 hypothetical protein HMPREF1449_00800 [Helicobacter pylori HP260AFii]EMH69168.1 hypothetical protein HMPREF1450_00299 [Helicobacter pylori HP260ASii]